MKSPILSPELNFATFSEFRSHIPWFDSIGPLNFAMISKLCSEISHAYSIGELNLVIFTEFLVTFLGLGGDSIAFNFIALIIAPDSSKY